MGIAHRFFSGIPDDGDTTLVQPSNWNDTHLFTALDADPASPADGEVWVTASGTTPNRIFALKIRDGGVTYVIASIVV